MNIKLMFDYYSRIIFIPDGYIENIYELQNSFFEWMHEQPECMIESPINKFAYSYNEYDFLNFINSVVLIDSREKAYFITNEKKIQGKISIIKF